MPFTTKTISVNIATPVAVERRVLKRLDYARTAADALVPIYTDIFRDQAVNDVGDRLHDWYVRMMKDPKNHLGEDTHPMVKMGILEALHDEATTILMNANDGYEASLLSAEDDLLELADDPHIPIYLSEIDILVSDEDPQTADLLASVKDNGEYYRLGGKIAYSGNQFDRARVVLTYVKYC